MVSVLCRMAFDFGLWSDGAAPLLFVCEEAHRYAPADKKVGFGPTKRALSRIAKEGRKYGVFLGLVTQRPAEIDPTIISQCSTLFVMRLANDRDQALIRSAVSDAAANLLSFIPSLGTREVFTFGSGVALPTRMRFTELAGKFRPNSEAAGDTRADGSSVGDDLIAAVIDRWRSASMSHRSGAEDLDYSSPLDTPLQPAVAAAPAMPAAPPPSPRGEALRSTLLKKPLDAGALAGATPGPAPAPPPGYPSGNPAAHPPAMPPGYPASKAPPPGFPQSHPPATPPGYPSGNPPATPPGYPPSRFK